MVCVRGIAPGRADAPESQCFIIASRAVDPRPIPGDTRRDEVGNVDGTRGFK